jgi:hypothetical protein
MPVVPHVASTHLPPRLDAEDDEGVVVEPEAHREAQVHRERALVRHGQRVELVQRRLTISKKKKWRARRIKRIEE